MTNIDDKLDRLSDAMLAGFEEVTGKFEGLDEKFEEINDKMDIHSQRFGHVEEMLEEVRAVQERHSNQFDTLAGAVDKLASESGAGTSWMKRLEIRISMLENKLGINHTR